MDMRQDRNHKCIQINEFVCCTSMDMRQECTSHATLYLTPSNQTRAAKHANADTTKQHCKHTRRLRGRGANPTPQHLRTTPRSPKTFVYYEAGVRTLHPNTCKPAPHITKTPVDYEAGVQTHNFNTIPNYHSDANNRNALLPKAPL